MTKIDIVSGFLGAGKTTLIKKLLKEALSGEQVVLIENEFGEIGIDGGFLKDSGIEITEMNSGCICCSLVGDFGTALKEVLDKYHPDRILIEPSGVGKLSDVMRAVENATSSEGVHLNSAVAVVDAKKCKAYLKNFGEFFANQIEHAGTVILSRTGEMSDEKINAAVALVREHNQKAAIITTAWDKLEGAKILETIEDAKDLEAELMAEVLKAHGHDHEHHHEHGEDCTCGCHDHDHGHHHDHHHHADEVFTSVGVETASKFTKEQVQACLDALEEEETYGIVLRAKGMLPTEGDLFLHFDHVPGESEIRDGSAESIGKICVIGSRLQEERIKALFMSEER